MQTAAVSVATILGSGILGLPVSLARAGLPPFIVSFTFTLLAQLGIVYAVTELLQRAQVNAHKEATAPDLYELLPYQTPSADESFESLSSVSAGLAQLNGLIPEEEVEDSSPSLHTFSELYLPHVSLRVFFEVAVILHFVSISSTYAIGAPQAFREVFPALQVISASQMTLAFTVIVAIAALFFTEAILVPLTVATFVKGALLTILVAVVLGIGIDIGEKPTTDWSLDAGLEPYLMGTLALSGVF
jgi:amino acid permease